MFLWQCGRPSRAVCLESPTYVEMPRDCPRCASAAPTPTASAAWATSTSCQGPHPRLLRGSAAQGVPAPWRRAPTGPAVQEAASPAADHESGDRATAGRTHLPHKLIAAPALSSPPDVQKDASSPRSSSPRPSLRQCAGPHLCTFSRRWWPPRCHGNHRARFAPTAPTFFRPVCTSTA